MAIGPWGSAHFIEAIGVGLLALAISQPDNRADSDEPPVEEREERIKGGLSWIRERLWKYRPRKLKITLDGTVLSGEYILAEIMNIRHVGPSLQLAPAADPGDGQLDVVLLPSTARDQLDEHLARLMEGRTHSPQWKVVTGRRLQLVCDGADVHIDDKKWPQHDSTPTKQALALTISVNEHALEFLV
jgi:diacylglycerol kinase family enzyme